MLVDMNLLLAKMFYQKNLLKKAAAIKIFGYSPLSSELRKQTSVAEKQHQHQVDKVFEANKREEDKTKNI